MGACKIIFQPSGRRGEVEQGKTLLESAQSLGVHRNTLRNKVCSLGIPGKDYSRRPTRQRRRT